MLHPLSVCEQSFVDDANRFARRIHSAADPAHDVHHLDRVRRLALEIAENEGGNRLVIELAALLHDVDDPKVAGNTADEPGSRALEWMKNSGVPPEIAALVHEIVIHIGFRKSRNNTPLAAIEYAVVRDADRLDALGAIGVARCISYNGFRGRAIFDPETLPATPEQYANPTAHRWTALNHFFEKLLTLKDGMLTPTGKRLAAARHAVMAHFVEAYFAEFFARGEIPAAWRTELSALGLEVPQEPELSA